MDNRLIWIFCACFSIPSVSAKNDCPRLPSQFHNRKFFLWFDPRNTYQRYSLGFIPRWVYLNYDGDNKYWLYCLHENVVDGKYYFIERRRCHEIVMMTHGKAILRARTIGDYDNLDKCKKAVSASTEVTIGIQRHRFHDDLKVNCPFHGSFHAIIHYPGDKLGCVNDEACIVKLRYSKVDIQLTAPRAGEKRPILELHCSDYASGSLLDKAAGNVLLLIANWPDHSYRAVYCARYQYLDPYANSVAFSILFHPNRTDLIQALCQRGFSAVSVAPNALTMTLRKWSLWQRERCTVPSRFQNKRFIVWSEANDYKQIEFKTRLVKWYKKTQLDQESMCRGGYTKGKMFYYTMEEYCYRVALMDAGSLLFRSIHMKWIDSADCLKDVSIKEMPIILAPITNELGQGMVCPFANSKYQAMYKGQNSRFQCVGDQQSTVDILDGRLSFDLCDGTSQTNIDKFRRITFLCGDTIAGSYLDSDHNGRAILLYTEGHDVIDREFYCARYINARNAIQLSIVIHPGKDPTKNWANCIENHSAVSGSKKALTLKLTDMDKSNKGGDNEPENPEDDFSESEEDKAKKYTYGLYVASPLLTGIVVGIIGYCVGSCSVSKKATPVMAAM